MKSENISFQKMQAGDLKLLHRWFEIPHVTNWYARDKKFTFGELEEKYLPRINDTAILSFIIYDKFKPVGYIQLYHLVAHLPAGILNYHHPLFSAYKPEELAGLDLFIADIDYLRTGFMSQALKKFMTNQIKNKFRAVVVDPLNCNTAAVLFFKKNQFTAIQSQVQNHYVMINTMTDV